MCSCLLPGKSLYQRAGKRALGGAQQTLGVEETGWEFRDYVMATVFTLGIGEKSCREESQRSNLSLHLRTGQCEDTTQG